MSEERSRTHAICSPSGHDISSSTTRFCSDTSTILSTPSWFSHWIPFFQMVHLLLSTGEALSCWEVSSHTSFAYATPPTTSIPSVSIWVCPHPHYKNKLVVLANYLVTTLASLSSHANSKNVVFSVKFTQVSSPTEFFSSTAFIVLWGCNLLCNFSLYMQWTIPTHITHTLPRYDADQSDLVNILYMTVNSWSENYINKAIYKWVVEHNWFSFSCSKPQNHPFYTMVRTHVHMQQLIKS